MAHVDVIFWRAINGEVPVESWLLELDRHHPAAFLKCRRALETLRERGHELKRPDVENLNGGLYELRVKLGHVNFRFLYCFHARTSAVVLVALTKEAQIPETELRRARERKELFEHDPRTHSYVSPLLPEALP
ncbi:MAG: type II toxin-antitoxin system RelE/ParE family toxin [bacterium]